MVLRTEAATSPAPHPGLDERCDPGRDAAASLPETVVGSVAQSLVTVLPFAVFVDEALPVFDWVTVVVLEFDAVALPVVIDAVPCPCSLAFDVFDALPPVFPAVLPSSAQSTLPPRDVRRRRSGCRR